MHNLNVNLASTAASAAGLNILVDSTATPRTPEILNSLIAMTNPMDNYSFGNNTTKTSSKPPTNLSSDSNSSSSSQMESPTTNPPSVQQTCSQLIKAGLKLSIEQKRKLQSDGEDLLDLDKCKRIKKNECSESEEDRNKQDGVRIICLVDKINTRTNFPPSCLFMHKIDNSVQSVAEVKNKAQPSNCVIRSHSTAKRF